MQFGILLLLVLLVIFFIRGKLFKGVLFRVHQYLQVNSDRHSYSRHTTLLSYARYIEDRHLPLHCALIP